VKVSLHLTHDCNLRCVYCYVGEKDARRMSRDTAELAVRFAHENSTRSVDISFFGGEPFLEKETMLHVVSYAQAWRRQEGITKPLRFFATTNGLCLDEETLIQCRDAGITLSLSLDGHGSCHDATRPLPDGRGSFEVLAPRFPLIQRYVPDIPVLATFSTRTVDRLADGIEKLFFCGFRTFSVGINYEEEWPEAALETLREQYRHLAAFYEARFRGGERMSLNVFDTKIAAHIHPECERCACCDQNDGEIAIAPSGNIYPCLRLVKRDDDPTLCLGNIATGLDRKRRAKIMLEAGREWPDCAACRHRGRCFHYCSALNVKVTGRFNQPPAALCREEQIAIEMADAMADRLYQDRVPAFLRRFYPGSA